MNINELRTMVNTSPENLNDGEINSILLLEYMQHEIDVFEENEKIDIVRDILSEVEPS